MFKFHFVIKLIIFETILLINFYICLDLKKLFALCDYCELFKLRYQQLRHKTPNEVCEMQREQPKKSSIKGTRWNEREKKESGNREKKIHKEFLTKLEVQTTI